MDRNCMLSRGMVMVMWIFIFVFNAVILIKQFAPENVVFRKIGL